MTGSRAGSVAGAIACAALLIVAWPSGCVDVVEGAWCTQDKDCARNQVCKFQQCRAPCPCGAGEQCVEDLCYSLQCENLDAGCSNGEVCIGARCGDPLCNGLQCAPRICDPARRACVDCVEDEGCLPQGKTCDTSTGMCVCVPTGAESCTDRLDNDCNGSADCADTTACHDRPCDPFGRRCDGGACRCPGGQSSESTCGDGEDNDCDGLRDCSDPDCSGQVCLAATDLCDLDDRCNASGACVGGARLPAGTVCRPATGACDQEERCDGTGVACPEDAPAPAATVCRPSTGPCDPEETCGGAFTCPGDVLLPPSAICLPAAGDCDLDDYCTGDAGPCPGDAKKAIHTPCADEGNECTRDFCNGAGTCLHIGLDAGTPCNADSNECTNDICNAAGACTHPGQDAGLACTPDSNPCTRDECNGAGSCIHPAQANNTACGASSICCDGGCVVNDDIFNCGTCRNRCTGGNPQCCDGTCAPACLR
jgi:hypothetical protein